MLFQKRSQQSWLLTFPSHLSCSMNEYMDLEAQRGNTPNLNLLNRRRRQSRKALKRAIFQATKPICKFEMIPLVTFLSGSKHSCLMLIFHAVTDGRTILTFITLYSLTVFSLNLSWNLTAADLSSNMLDVLEIMTVLLHTIFFLYSLFMWVFCCWQIIFWDCWMTLGLTVLLACRIHSLISWKGSGLQSYFDAAISIILPFIDWHFKLQISLSTGQIIILSLLNGYITFRFYQKTLATVSHQAVTLKGSVEREYISWGGRGYHCIHFAETNLPLP